MTAGVSVEPVNESIQFSEMLAQGLGIDDTRGCCKLSSRPRGSCSKGV